MYHQKLRPSVWIKRLINTEKSVHIIFLVFKIKVVEVLTPCFFFTHNATGKETWTEKGQAKAPVLMRQGFAILKISQTSQESGNRCKIIFIEIDIKENYE